MSAITLTMQPAQRDERGFSVRPCGLLPALMGYAPRAGSSPQTSSLTVRRPESKFLSLLLLLPLLLCSFLKGAEVIDIGTRRELFVDRFIIDEMMGASLKLHTPQIAPPVEPPRPHGHYATLIRDGDRFLFYYRGEKVPDMHWRDGWEEYGLNQVTMRAESTDGIRWTLPDYGIYRHPAFPEGNVILADNFLANANFTPFLDTRPGVSPDSRFKAVGGLGYQKQFAKYREKYGPGGLLAYASADGVHWKRMQEAPVIPEAWGTFDSQNIAFWSETERMYVCYFRLFENGLRS
ncbi:MAG: hypothetical protein FJ388_07520, partial [Verrucomicrobia bacterium]|nr:hypothetical protein [Verrucomicrobiota bacterium]